MSVAHKLIGYDRQTEWVAAEYAVPAQHFDRIRLIAGVSRADPDALGSYPLGAPEAQEIERLIGMPLDTSRMDFFLEPEPVP